MGKSALIKKIHNAAVNYQKYLAGRTFLYVYDDSVVEIVFKSSSFQHLTGVKTKDSMLMQRRKMVCDQEK